MKVSEFGGGGGIVYFHWSMMIGEFGGGEGGGRF